MISTKKYKNQENIQLLKRKYLPENKPDKIVAIAGTLFCLDNFDKKLYNNPSNAIDLNMRDIT